MNVIVHYNQSAIEISPSSYGGGYTTWAKVTQRFVEHSLLHSPHLLPLLASISKSSSSNNHSRGAIKNKNGGVDMYMIRFGDGYATMIRTMGSNTSRGSSYRCSNFHADDDDDDNAGEVIEANVSLKPRAVNGTNNDHTCKQCHPSAKIPEPKNGLEGGSLEDTVHVDLIVEVVRSIGEEEHQQRHRRGRSRNSNTLPMTQAPFPFDVTKTNVLCLWEHSKFKGVVAHFTLERWSGASVNNEKTMTTLTTKRQRASSEQETNTQSSTKRTKNSSKRPLNGFMVFRSEIRPVLKLRYPGMLFPELAKKIGEEYRALPDDRRQKYIDDARVAMRRYDEKHKELARSTSKSYLKTTKKKKSKDEEDVMKGVSLVPSKPSPLLSRPDGDDADDKEEDSEEETDLGGHYTFEEVDSDEEVDEENLGSSVGFDNGGSRRKIQPKRPVNAFWLYASEVRDQVGAAHPNLKGFKLNGKIAEAWDALDNDAKNWYKAMSDKTITNYKKKFGENALKYGHRSNFKLPTGWTTRVVPRQDQSKRTKDDTYFYSPIKSFVFRSMTAVNRFQELLKESDGDEVKAFKVFKRNKMTRKSMDVPNTALTVSKKARKSKQKNKKKHVLVEKNDVEEKSASESEEDGMPDGWNCESEEDEIPDSWNSESEEDEIPDSWNSKTKEDGMPDGENSESEEDEIPDSWNCKTEEDGMPDGENSESEEDEIPDSWNCKTEEDGMPDGENYESEEDEMPDTWIAGARRMRCPTTVDAGVRKKSKDNYFMS